MAMKTTAGKKNTREWIEGCLGRDSIGSWWEKTLCTVLFVRKEKVVCGVGYVVLRLAFFVDVVLRLVFFCRCYF